MDRLSENFTYDEFVHSQTADNLGIDNVPTEDQLENGRMVCDFILEPVRVYVGRSITPMSFFRCEELNIAVGGSGPSQHKEGEAVDFRVIGVDTLKLARWMVDNLDFDQLILEHYKGGSTGWIHCSFLEGLDGKVNRNKVNTKIKGQPYLEGLIK